MVPLAATAPPQLTSDLNPDILLGVFVALSAAAFLWAALASVRSRDVVPIAVCVGALICAFNEPVYDLLGKIIYAQNLAVAYTALGRHIPWFLVLGYVPWVGLLPWLISRLMAGGVPRRRLCAISAGSFASVAVVESVGTSLHSWGYYGVVPLKYLVVAPQMAAVPIVGGLLLYLLDDRVVGWRRLLLAIVPTVTLPMVYASVSWPLYIALGSQLPTALNWIIAALMLGLTATTVWVATGLAERWYAAGVPSLAPIAAQEAAHVGG
jgi:hypothetical protein